jgi:hydrogenase maturation protease
LSVSKRTEIFIQMKTIVIGLGNPILGDDGVGWHVVEEVQRQLTLLGKEHDLDVDFLSLGGISLMEHLIGYERVILVDAILTEGELGLITLARLDEIPNYSAFHITSAHDTSLQTALQLGKKLGAQLPEDVTIVGISIQRAYDFSEELSPPVQQAIPKAVEFVLDLAMQKIIIP